MITLENIDKIELEKLTIEQFRELIKLARKGLETQKALADWDDKYGLSCDEDPPYTTQFG